MQPPLRFSSNAVTHPGPVLRLTQSEAAVQIRLVRGVRAPSQRVGEVSPQRREIIAGSRSQQMPRGGPNSIEKLQPAGGIVNGPAELIETPDELIKSSEIRMIRRLHVQAVELSLTFNRIACGQRSRDAVGQGDHRVVEEQIHLRRVLRREVTSPHQPMQLRVCAHTERRTRGTRGSPRRELLWLLHQADAPRVRYSAFQLRQDVGALAHQHLVQQLYLATPPRLVVAVEQPARIEKQIERRKRALLHELRIHLRLQLCLDRHQGANSISRSSTPSAVGDALFCVYRWSASTRLSACNCSILSSTVSCAMSLYTNTDLVCPMRWARSVACASTAGFHHGS